MTGVSRTEIQDFILQLAQANQLPPGNSVTTVDTPPVIPPEPSPATEIIDVSFDASVGIFTLVRPVVFERLDGYTT